MKVSLALRGRTKTQEHKDSIASALKGVPKSDATKARMRAARRARPKMTPQLLALQARAETEDRHRRQEAVRIAQWHEDLAVSRELGEELFQDVLSSQGWSYKRRLHDPRVSDGYDHKAKKVKKHGEPVDGP